ncbi:hypothetical protein P7K49_016943 [Saguinus oedipus]|uniref:Uncharacterized protein n=1 Tax=Saguinus oedipus TaxID=9490 RepID=A0ABQ9V3T1_SAGOE|nr:hypothetical protein P7K49_016943 [Saguinus oedipus]
MDDPPPRRGNAWNLEGNRYRVSRFPPLPPLPPGRLCLSSRLLRSLSPSPRSPGVGKSNPQMRIWLREGNNWQQLRQQVVALLLLREGSQEVAAGGSEETQAPRSLKSCHSLPPGSSCEASPRAKWVSLVRVRRAGLHRTRTWTWRRVVWTGRAVDST